MEAQTFMFFGLAGSGKGTQVKLLMDFLKEKDGENCVYAGTGEGFRKLTTKDTLSSRRVKEIMLQGSLVPDFLTTSIFTNILIESLDEKAHLFTDGYPRNVSQSESFEQMMDFYKREKIKIIYIELSKEEAIKRNLLRGREDDTKAGMEKRIEEFNNNVLPSMNYFTGKQNYEIYTINGEQSVEDVHQEIINKLNL